MITIKIQECFEDTNGNVVGVAPAGARFAKLRFYLSAASASVAPFNGTVFFDQMGLVEL